MSQPGPRRSRVAVANIALVVVLLAVVGGTAAWLAAGRSDDPAAAVRTVPVGRGLVARTVAASGTVVSATTSQVGFSTGGQVTDVRVGLGERVVEGQVLATLDDRSARANLQAARAGLTAANQQLDDAESGTATASSSGGGAGAGTAAGGAAQGGGQSTSAGQIDQARSQVAQARATLVDAERTVDATVLTAPQSGTVVSLDGREGQTVSGTGTQVTSSASGSPSAGASSSGAGAGAGGTGGSGASGGGAGSSGAGGSGAGSASGSASAGSSFLSLADLDSLQVRAQLPELDVGQVRDGQTVAVTVNALPGQSLRGVVSRVDTLPGSGASVQYGTTIGLEGRPPGLRLGQSASVAITTAQAEGALFLPNAAIEPQGGVTATQGSVLVYAGGREERRAVGLGVAADTVTQITSGLSVGDLVVLPEPVASPLFQGGRGGNGGGGPPGNSGSGNSGSGNSGTGNSGSANSGSGGGSGGGGG